MDAKERDSFALLAALRAGLAGDAGPSDSLAALCAKLGALAIPQLLRSLAAGPTERARAQQLLLSLPDELRPRVAAAMRTLGTGEQAPLAAAAAPVLPTIAPTTAELQARLAARLAAQVEHRADAAAAAELMMRRLEPERVVELVLVIARHTPGSAAALAAELAARAELPAPLRVSLLRAVASAPEPTLPGSRVLWTRLLLRPDGAAAIAVVGTGATADARRGLVLWRAPDGGLVDAWYADATSVTHVERVVLAGAGRAGYRRADGDLPLLAERAGLAARARVRRGEPLPSAYYLGRDLLGLTCEHLGAVVPWRRPHLLHGLGVERLAARDAAGARPALERAAALAPDDAEIAGSLGVCLLELGDAADAARWLQRARELAPADAQHHWNHAAASDALGADAARATALRAFLRTSAAADAAQAARRARAAALVGAAGPGPRAALRTRPARRGAGPAPS